MCGEKPRERLCLGLILGSPPRVRGKEIHLGEIDLQDRITPACAGKSDPDGQHSGTWLDHPRVCGEKTKKIP